MYIKQNLILTCCFIEINTNCYIIFFFNNFYNIKNHFCVLCTCKQRYYYCLIISAILLNINLNYWCYNEASTILQYNDYKYNNTLFPHREVAVMTVAPE